jgi:hypothetical protein
MAVATPGKPLSHAGWNTSYGSDWEASVSVPDLYLGRLA